MTAIQKRETIKDLFYQFQSSKTIFPHQFEKKVAKILDLPKNHQQELYDERLKTLFSEKYEKTVSN